MATRKRTTIDFRQYHPVGCLSTGAALAATDNAVNFYSVGPYSLEIKNTAQNDDIIPVRNADGWILPNDNTDNDGAEISHGVISDTTSRYVYKVGTDPAFFMEMTLKVPDVSDYDVCFGGFRKIEAQVDILAAATLGTGYTDISGINLNIGALNSVTRLNTGTATVTDTTVAVADGVEYTFRVNVSAAGVVTFLINGAAPTVNTNTLTHDSGDLLMPFFVYAKNAGAASDTPPILKYFKHGLQG